MVTYKAPTTIYTGGLYVDHDLLVSNGGMRSGTFTTAAGTKVTTGNVQVYGGLTIGSSGAQITGGLSIFGGGVY